MMKKIRKLELFDLTIYDLSIMLCLSVNIDPASNAHIQQYVIGWIYQITNILCNIFAKYLPHWNSKEVYWTPIERKKYSHVPIFCLLKRDIAYEQN